MSHTSLSRKESEAALIAKAQAEPAFRQALLKSPKAAIEKEFGVTLPASAELRVVEETATTSYLVLPIVPGGELADAELEDVAGGFFASFFAAPALRDLAAKVEENRAQKEQIRKAQALLE